MRRIGITGMILFLIFLIFLISTFWSTLLQHFDPLGCKGVRNLYVKINLIHFQMNNFDDIDFIEYSTSDKIAEF